jgi:acetoin utilization deacetylase AcuC-like enzyme
VSGRAGLILAPEARSYDLGPQHPFRPERVLFTWDLIRACGLLELPNVQVFPGRTATDEEILLVHTPEFVDATRRAGHGEDGPWSRFGYGPGDNPVFPNMHEAAAIVVGATIAAAEAVLDGSVAHAFNASGGLHHAMPARASGFCVYDDPAAVIAWMLVAASAASRTSTSTCITATACRRSSTRIRGCSRSRSTNRASTCSPVPGS